MTDSSPLWAPTTSRVSNSRLTAFIDDLKRQHGLSFDDYQQLHQWSIDHPALFWQQVWDFCNIHSSQNFHRVLSHADAFMDATWFEGARFNFAENLLKQRSDDTAIISVLENGQRTTLSFNALYDQVSVFASALRSRGVVAGDRVAGFMPNITETIVAMLATTSIGAIWTSCSPDFGSQGVLDRFGQIQPKIIIACNGYFYNGKTISSIDTLKSLVDTLEDLSTLIIVPVIADDAYKTLSKAVTLSEFVRDETASTIPFAQLPFDHPLYIMYSSGTTGVPKCIVHSAGGTLLQHVKEHQLHVDIQQGDRFFFYSTCGWMMWNWLVSGLASGATLVLYDGSPFYPSPTALFDLIDQEAINIFGISAKFIAAVEKAGVIPRQTHDLCSLRTVMSTGSPLSHESFEFVYQAISADVCLSSISGGTDILSCFVLGNNTLPVWKGEIQCLGLGMAVEFWDDDGKPVSQEKGELVCTQPFPSAPIGFWHDPDNHRYTQAYFARYPNIWAHGDYGELTQHAGVIIHGRSDAVLNPGGVRIGTAEIYRQVEKIDAVIDSVCIGQPWQNDVRVILFVVLRDDMPLSDDLVQMIKQTIRDNTTPRHVPEKIIAVTDIPRTISGKVAELAVRNVVQGELVKNTDSLANPASLALFKALAALQS